MMVFNAPPKLLQDIAAVVGVQVAIADTDEQEARWIAEWLGTGDQAALVYGDANLQPEEHAPDCMIWQIDSAADSGSGFPEPEDVACTCGLVDRLRDADLGARFTLDAFGPLELDTKPSAQDDEEMPY